MIAPGVDYDPADDDSEPDGLPGVSADAEDDDSDCSSAHDDDSGFYIRDIRGFPGDPEDGEDDDPSGDSLDAGEGENDAARGLLTEKPSTRSTSVLLRSTRGLRCEHTGVARWAQSQMVAVAGGGRHDPRRSRRPQRP